MTIGIVGSGLIGGVVGTLWAKAGHSVLFSSRHPETLDGLVAKVGPNARRGTVDEAIAFGEVVFLSIPYVAVEAFGKEHPLAGKVVLETGNPYPERDGAIGVEVRESKEGTGIYSAHWLPGARLVRAFNTVRDDVLAKEAHRPDPMLGIPLAGDDAEALRIAARLVKDAGFDPVVVGPLASAKSFDFGASVYDSNKSGPEVRAALGLPAGR